jgi:hypothetical protein
LGSRAITTDRWRCGTSAFASSLEPPAPGSRF